MTDSDNRWIGGAERDRGMRLLETNGPIMMRGDDSAVGEIIRLVWSGMESAAMDRCIEAAGAIASRADLDLKQCIEGALDIYSYTRAQMVAGGCSRDEAVEAAKAIVNECTWGSEAWLWAGYEAYAVLSLLSCSLWLDVVGTITDSWADFAEILFLLGVVDADAPSPLDGEAVLPAADDPRLNLNSFRAALDGAGGNLLLLLPGMVRVEFVDGGNGWDYLSGCS